MSFKILSPYYADAYKVSHKRMLAPGTTKLYGTWIPRSLKHIHPDIKKVVSFGQQITTKWLHDEWQENFFDLTWEEASQFGKDMTLMLMQEYDDSHFKQLHELGYLPIRIKSLPEGIETLPNIPHMTFINTVDGFAWLTLYLETIISSLSWKSATSATLALRYKRVATEWVMKTDPDNLWLVDYMCHDFSARGLSPWDMITSGLSHASSFRGSDTLAVIPAARYFYNEPINEVVINSVNASEHSVSTTKIFTCGEKQMIIDWLIEFPEGILSIVADTFDLWKLITEYIADPEVKALIMARNGKVVLRPDSGNPVDIVCGVNPAFGYVGKDDACQNKGVIELLWDIFGGTTNKQGYKVLDSHIGAIYGDSINLERQTEIYSRLANKGFASTNIVLGVGSFTYQFNSRDTMGFAAKGAWFENDGKGIDIYKEPVTDDGTKKSLKGKCCVVQDDHDYIVLQQCDDYEEQKGLLQTIYENGKFFNQTTLTQIRERLNKQ